jgi:sodium transport system permease protein
MKRNKILTVFQKEFRDTFRDKSTIFSVLVLPLVIYPLMFLGIGLLFGMQRQGEERRIAQVAVIGGPREQRLMDILRNEPKIAVVDLPEPRQLLKDGDIQAVLEFKPSAGGRLPLAVLYDEANRNSEVAKTRVKKAIDVFQHKLVVEQVINKNLDTMMLNPLTVEYNNVASPQKMGGFIMGMILPYMIVMLLMIGALHTAMDTTAGEKERRTIETLLVSSAGRREIVAGKLLTAIVTGLITALAGLVSLGLTAASGVSVFSIGARHADLHLSISPVALLLSFITLAPTAVLLASLLLALGCFARSVKEGNAYAQYLMMAVIMLAMGSMTPMDPSPKMFAIPVLNTALCQKELLMGIINWEHIGMAILTTSLLAIIAAGITLGLFSQERVLFRS